MQTTIFNEDEVKSLLAGIGQVRSLDSVPESFLDELQHEVAEISKTNSADLRIECDAHHLIVLRVR